ncbi:MAG: 3-oxoacyl-[acyl-carrier-protein] synthase III C-terminal domain-containing protein [Chitinispirillia bacterium]
MVDNNSKKSEHSVKSLKYGCRFESIGIKLPDIRMSTKDLMKTVRSWQDIKLESLTGIKERRLCSKNEDSYTLAVDAAKDCLKNSSYKASDLELVICCSISRFKGGLDYYYEPPLSVFIKESIGSVKAMSFDINNACAGMLTGVFIANNMISLGVVKCAMVVSGESISSLCKNACSIVKTLASKQLASLTVGDAGAAVILEQAANGSKLAVSNFVTLSQYSDLCIGQAAKGSPGAMMTTEAVKIHRVAISESPPILEAAINASGLKFNELDHIIPHQTSIKAIRSGAIHASKHFGVYPKNIVITVDRFANTATTTHFLALYTSLNENKFKHGENIMLISYASGLVVGVIIFKMDELVYKYGRSN